MDKELNTFFGGYKTFPPSGDNHDDRMDALIYSTAAQLGETVKYELGPEPAKTPIRYDKGKTDWTFIPMEALEEVVQVLEFGAQKYSRDNWRSGEGFKYSRVVNSLLRHTYSWWRGEDRDPESGFSHLAHMGCNIIFLLYYNRYKERFHNDDRYKE